MFIILMSILIPVNEKRKFKYGVLPNKLKYTIIYDTDTTISNISLCVKTGIMNDPLEYMGLAHFLEHMLFLGSNKYKEESYFDKKLKSYGGNSNAYTSFFETVYYFTVLSENLDEMLDIFSRFFIDPLFDENSVSREINAINSEHMKNLNNDFWILRQLIYDLSHNNSMINKFGTGSLETLQNGNNVREKIIEFYNKYYCSDNMTLTIVSNKSIESIEKIINTYFSEIKYKISDKIEYNNFKFDTFMNEYQLVPVADKDYIVYYWDINPMFDFLDDIIINIIDDTIVLNCEKNLINTLISMNLASRVNTMYLDEGIYILMIYIIENSNYNDIAKKINDIVRYYFDNLIKFDWVKIFNYMKKKYELNYNYSKKYNNLAISNSIAVNMHYYDEQDIYRGQKIILKDNIQKIYDTIKYLVFNKVNIIYGTKKNISNNIKLIEKYYKKEYCKLNISLIPLFKNTYDFKLAIHSDILNINPINIPKLDKYNIPKKINNRLWYGGVSQFNEPYVYAEVHINHNKLYDNIKTYMLTQIAIKIINYYIELIFCQEIGIGYDIYFSYIVSDGTIILVINGVNYNFIDIFNKVIYYIKKIKPNNQIINLIISKIKQNLIDINTTSPWDYTDIIISQITHPYNYSYLDKIKIFTKININMIKKRIKRIVKFIDIPVKTIIYGNIISNNIHKLATNNINMNIKFPSQPIALKLKNITLKHPNPNENNKCITYIFPFGIYEPYKIAMCFILYQMLEQPVFEELRTKAQLGYLVKCLLYNDGLYNYSIHIKIQSDKDIEFVKDKINIFLKWFSDNIKKYNIDKFDKIKKSIYNLLTEKYINIDDMISAYSVEIRTEKYIFNRKKIIAEQIKKVKLNDIIKLYHLIIKKKYIIIIN